jgi:hypothetical protein
MTTHEGAQSVDNDDFAVVPEVELEAIRLAPRGVKGRSDDSFTSHFLDIGFGKRVAADLVKKKINTDIFPGFSNQAIFQLSSQAVILDDEKLKLPAARLRQAQSSRSGESSAAQLLHW